MARDVALHRPVIIHWLPSFNQHRRKLAQVVALLAWLAVAGPTVQAQKFSFGAEAKKAGVTAVADSARYTRALGYGFDPGGTEQAFRFTVGLAQEGNYRVTIKVGDPRVAVQTTIRAELRRLMIESRDTAAGEVSEISFIVNTRTPLIAGGRGIAPGEVRLKAPRETTQESAAWDDALTLEFTSERRALRSLEITPVTVPTVFLLGDSTVCDQSREPYSSWGQMLPRWFNRTIAIANHGESGETYRDSIGRRRLDKILSVMHPGDWLIMQFGHNDQKQIAAKTGGAATTYAAEIRKHVEAFRARGGVPIIVTPMERRGFDEAGKVRPSLLEYRNAAKNTAEELGVACLDLNAMSTILYESLGPEKSADAFAKPQGRVDNTHHNNYGSYQLAQCILQSICEQNLPLAHWISNDFKAYDPRKPDDLASFHFPASAEVTHQRPLGDEAK